MNIKKKHLESQPFAKLKEVFCLPLADTKTPHLILPNRTKSPPTTRQVDNWYLMRLFSWQTALKN